MVAFFCSTVLKFHWLYCVGNLDSQHWVDFKIESVYIIESHEKENKILYSLRNGNNYSQALDSW